MAVEVESEMGAGLVAGVDLSANQFMAVIPSTTADFTVIAATTAGAPIEGILKNNPTAGFPAAVQRNGLCKCKAGGTIARGARVMSSATGSIVTAATTGSTTIGIAQEAAVSGQIFAVLLQLGSGTV